MMGLIYQGLCYGVIAGFTVAGFILVGVFLFTVTDLIVKVLDSIEAHHGGKSDRRKDGGSDSQ